MKKSIAMKWVKALRSGKYKQTKDTLKNNEGHCCLGVLCSISRKKGWTGYQVLPIKIAQWAGMKTERGLFLNGGYGTLTSLNDTRDYSFGAIANVIEKNWKNL